MALTPKERVLMRMHGIRPPIPDKLKALFAITKKSELIKYIHDLKITGGDFDELIRGCCSIGYIHIPQFHDSIPSHLNIDADGLLQCVDTEHPNEIRKMRRKISALFDERRVTVAHVFINKQRQWHLFYFTHVDTNNSKNNHWRHGTHVHFINHLWPRLNIEKIWADFSKTRRKEIPGSEHIRFAADED